MRLYLATRFIRGKEKSLNKGDHILLAPEKAQRLVEKGVLVEADPINVLLQELMQAGGKVVVKSNILKETITFCINEDDCNDGCICYTAEELAEILLKNPDPETLKLIHQVKKIFKGKIILKNNQKL